MVKFRYIGTDKSGKEVYEVVDTENRFSVYEIARNRNHIIKKIELINSNSKFDLFSKIRRVKADDLIVITRNLGSMIKAGLTTVRSLSVIERQIKNKKLVVALRSVQENINKGMAFNEALSEHPYIFNDLYVSMVKAGEESGSLADSLLVLSKQMEKNNNLIKRIKGAMIYPVIVITIMVIVGIIMMIYVVPKITEVFNDMGQDLPATTRFLINTSDFMSNHALLVLIGLVFFIFSFIYWLKTRLGKIVISWLVLRIPFIKTIAKEANAAQTARTLSSLLNSGVDIIRSLDITRDVLQNVFYKKVLKEAAIEVEKGNTLSETFVKNDKLYPILVGEMILVGEETGQISGMLKELAIFYETEVERKTKDMSTIVEPLLMVIIGITVGFFAMALISPIYSISNNLM